VQIGNDEEMEPREKLMMVPSAGRADVAELAMTVPDNSISGYNIVDATITQSDAPTLISSGEYRDVVLRTGNVVYSDGSDQNGQIKIIYPCFPNQVFALFAINAHYDANHSQVVAANGTELCEGKIIVSPPTSDPIRIQYLVVGN